MCDITRFDVLTAVLLKRFWRILLLSSSSGHYDLSKRRHSVISQENWIFILDVVADNLRNVRGTEGSNFPAFLSLFSSPFEHSDYSGLRVFCNVTPCCLVDGCKLTRGTRCLIQSSCIYFVFGSFQTYVSFKKHILRPPKKKTEFQQLVDTEPLTVRTEQSNTNHLAHRCRHLLGQDRRTYVKPAFSHFTLTNLILTFLSCKFFVYCKSFAIPRTEYEWNMNINFGTVIWVRYFCPSGYF